MRSRRNRRRAERAPLRWPIVNWGIIAVAAGAATFAVAAYLAAVSLLNRPITTISIAGAFKRVSPMQIEALVEPHARAGFVDIDLDATRRELVALPWVASAEIRRRWPGSLEVRIKEEEAVACWDERGLLNSAGELFLAEAEHIPAELPRLHGPAGTETQVTARYFRLQELLEHRGMAAVAVRLDERGAWEFRTNTGLAVRLGADSVEARIQRFFAVLDSTLSPLAGEVEYVDMRYPNGFAIGWKSGGGAAAAAAREQVPNA
jgi:cell division protein FtsQ